MGNTKKNIDIEIPDIDLGDLESIVNTGVKPKISFFTYLKTCFKELGFKNIFHDKNELIIITLVAILLIIAPISNLLYANINSLYKFIFIISPILYLSSVIFSFYNSKEKGAFDIEMTCKYNLYQLSAIRMFFFSLVSMLINTGLIVVVGGVFKQIDIIRMIIISITSILIFSTLLLYSLVKIKYKSFKYILIILWISINIFLSSIDYDGYIYFLMKAPLYIHLFISILCGILYVRNLNRLINYRQNKGEI